MPGFRTHYLFGWKALSQFVPNPKEDFLDKHPAAFQIGLQGPDVFFEDPFQYLFHKENIGIRMHGEGTMDFFSNLIDARNHLLSKNDRSIADAYIAGYIGHYTLDTVMHPYINYRTKSTENKGKTTYLYGIHVLLESDIDKALLRHFLHLRPSQFSCAETIAISPNEASVLSCLLAKAIHKTYPGSRENAFSIRFSLRWMRFMMGLTHDRWGIRKKIVRRLDEVLFRHAFLSTVIVTDDCHTYPDPCNLRHRTWCNPDEPSLTSQKDFYELFAEAEVAFIQRIHMYSGLIAALPKKNLKNLSKQAVSGIHRRIHPSGESQEESDYYGHLNRLLSELGDLSFDTGLPL